VSPQWWCPRCWRRLGGPGERCACGFDPASDDRDYVERLVATLRHPLGDRAVHAAATLGAIGDRRAVPGLLDALGAPDPYLQAEAARALGTLGDRRAAPALAELARTGSVPGRRAADDALAALDRGRRP
jgi:HEAT repeat protein